ncbi:MAG: GNAT family N-acetyltransferase [Candidatus Hadarchaeia archaeon]
MEVVIRMEREEDYEEIEKTVLLAFGDEDESEFVQELRNTEYYIPQLSLVAEIDGEVVGHMMFAPIWTENGEDLNTFLCLAPLAVLPAKQGLGIGTKLVEKGLERAEKLNYCAVFLLGDPDYYSRFGFVQSRERGFEIDLFSPSDEEFMVQELIDGCLKNRGGTLRFPPPFEVFD